MTRHLSLPLKSNVNYGPTGPIFMIIEIGYTLQLDKDSPKQNSWTYYRSHKTDFKDAVKDATKYFKTFVKENGWSRKAKITQIIKIRNANETTSS